MYVYACMCACVRMRMFACTHESERVSKQFGLGQRVSSMFTRRTYCSAILYYYTALCRAVLCCDVLSERF